MRQPVTNFNFINLYNQLVNEGSVDVVEKTPLTPSRQCVQVKRATLLFAKDESGTEQYSLRYEGSDAVVNIAPSVAIDLLIKNAKAVCLLDLFAAFYKRQEEK